MRTLRRTAAAALMAATMVVGGAATALAAPAPTGIAWHAYGTSVRPDGTVSLCPKQGGFTATQTLVVQVLRNDTWVKVKSYGPAQLKNQWCLYLTPSTLVSKPGKYVFRAVTRTSAGAPVSEARRTLKLVAARDYFYVTDYPEISTTTAKNRAVVVNVGMSYGQRLDLQRKSGSGWVNVSKAYAPRSGRSATVRIPLPAKAGLHSYRVVERASAWTTASTSHTLTIHQTDTARHRAYQAKARRYIARYCPQSPVYIDTPNVAGAGRYGRVGYATYWRSSTGRDHTLTTTIQLRSGLPDAQLRSVALHECAHVVQYRAVVEGRDRAEDQAAERRFPGTGTEGQADCMSYAITRDTRYFGYVRGCSAAQVADANRVWRAYGSKYQAPVHRWKS